MVINLEAEAWRENSFAMRSSPDEIENLIRGMEPDAFTVTRKFFFLKSPATGK